jgi:hypothetical protein
MQYILRVDVPKERERHEKTFIPLTDHEIVQVGEELFPPSRPLFPEISHGDLGSRARDEVNNILFAPASANARPDNVPRVMALRIKNLRREKREDENADLDFDIKKNCISACADEVCVDYVDDGIAAELGHDHAAKKSAGVSRRPTRVHKHLLIAAAASCPNHFYSG